VSVRRFLPLGIWAVLAVMLLPHRFSQLAFFTMKLAALPPL